jgi:hypothetical protein
MMLTFAQALAPARRTPGALAREGRGFASFAEGGETLDCALD